ncbi:MAG: hypothetical protein Q8P17_02145 [bacterium]|nr:hypothetical protein [bacterium]
MNILLILSVVVVILISLALFLWAVVIRKSRKKQVNGDSTSPSGDKGKGENGRSMKYWWTVPVALVGLAGLWWLWGKISTMSFHFVFSDVLGAAVPFAIIAGAVIVFTHLFKGDWAAIIRKGTWSLVVVFIAIGLLSLYGDWKNDALGSSQQAQQACSPISDAKVHRCVISERPRVFTTEQLAYSEALEFCIVRPTGTSYESKKVGPNSFEVKSASGTFPIEYKLLRGNCPDKF